MSIDPGNVLLFLLFALGHTAFIIAVTNRIHAYPLPLPFLHRTRQLHDLVIVILPLLFAWLCGFRGPALFFTGSDWHRLPVVLQIYLGVCGVVACSLPLVALYRFTRRFPLPQTRQTRTIDVAGELGYRPIGDGPYRLFTAIPGNEFLKLELAEKEFRLPHLPAAWDGLTILHLSDLHYTGVVDRPYFERLIDHALTMPADLVVFSGDLLDREDLVTWLPATLGRLSAPLGCYFVLGNHDSYLTNVPEIREHMTRLGWHDLSGRTMSLEYRGRPLVICGSETPWMGQMPDLTGSPPDAYRVLVSHTPDNLDWARRHHIHLMLAGHNHGGQIRLRGFGPVYSPSFYGTLYACGEFWRAPTLLHVSRGISGRHPLRWNCLPELIRLTLRSAPELSASGFTNQPAEAGQPATQG